jgi:hypothetical protein
MALSAQQRGDLTKDIRARAMAAHGFTTTKKLLRSSAAQSSRATPVK